MPSNEVLNGDIRVIVEDQYNRNGRLIPLSRREV
jgi:hypothetical protein